MSKIFSRLLPCSSVLVWWAYDCADYGPEGFSPAKCVYQVKKGQPAIRVFKKEIFNCIGPVENLIPI